MGCDIHLFAEKRVSFRKWETVDAGEALRHRSYSVFAFLAGVRNYSAIIPISKPRGLPMNVGREIANEHESLGIDAHTASWLPIKKLLDFDYSAICEDRRMHGMTLEKGVFQSYRDFLGEWFFKDLEQLHASGAQRIVFWFDN